MTAVRQRRPCTAGFRARGYPASPRSSGSTSTGPGGRSPRCAPGGRRRHAAARGARDQAGAHEERLGDLLDGLGLLPDGDGERGQAHRPAAEPRDERLEHRPVEPVETELVDVVDRQRGAGDRRA